MILGILGGMGPLASAEFVKTIYEFNTARAEQDSPACILFSDPAVPDRTEAILRNDSPRVVQHLTESLQTLVDAGADELVIACFTAHHFLPALPRHLRERVISLIDIAIDTLIESKKPHVLLCTHGTARVRSFQKHPRWHEIQPLIVTLNEHDQEIVHRVIYEKLKRNRIDPEAFRALDTVVRHSGAKHALAGCTDLHLLSRRMKGWVRGWTFTDPLAIFAKNLRSILDEQSTSRHRGARIAS